MAKKEPKVAVAFCVYNEEARHVRECIESVINQTYKNLEIIIVSNGVLVQESALLLQEYAKKDSRITILEKTTNESFAYGMNAVFDFLKGKYKIKEVESTKDKLNTFSITNENPYGINNIYKKTKIRNAPKVDFLLLHCADDSWELNLVEECLKRSEGVEIVWFTYDSRVELKTEWKDWTLQGIFKYDTEPEQIITPKDWLQRAIDIKQSHFWFMWQGLINFEFFSKIGVEFLPNIAHDDVHFGTFLFLHASKIYVLPKVLYHYRVRENSDSNIDGNVTKMSIIPPFRKILELFDNNLFMARYFHKSMSFMVMGLYLQDFIYKNPNHPNIELLQKAFMPHFHERYLDFLYFLNYFKSKMDTDSYFTICFNVVFELLETFSDKEPFKNVENPSIIKDQNRARQIQFVKDVLYLENNHILRLNAEKQALQNALAQAQERIKMLESCILK